MSRRTVDKPFLTILIVLVSVGFLIFISAALGLLARDGVVLSRYIFNQAFLGLLLGSIAAYGASRLHYNFWRTYGFYIFLLSLIATALVFIPGLGFEHGGARRWLSIASFSFQPAEFLKIGFVLYYAALLSTYQKKLHDFKYGLGPLLGLLAVIAFLLLLQPDTGTFLVIAGAGFIMFIVAGAKLIHILSLAGIGILGLGTLALFRPYVRARILTFINPGGDPLGAGYQIQQSLIAIGSGRWTGRGFGQSVQKFNFLPEPVGDSIFAVYAEEWGFLGAIVLISLFFALIVRGFRIATQAPSTYARLVVTGIISVIGIQSIINIAAMLAIFPLTGIPLTFVSQGGTALFFALLSAGIVLNVSRHTK